MIYNIIVRDNNSNNNNKTTLVIYSIVWSRSGERTGRRVQCTDMKNIRLYMLRVAVNTSVNDLNWLAYISVYKS